MSKVIYQPAANQDSPYTIVHRMVQYQQCDLDGTKYNIVRIILRNGEQKFVREEVEVEEEKEVLFDLSAAQGHKWYLTKTSLRVIDQHEHSECSICEIYSANKVYLN